VAWPLAAWQQAERMRRVGVLTYGADVNTDADANFRPIPQLVRNELEKLGWIEGRNLQLDFRFGFGNATQTLVFAADLVQLAPDVIVTMSTVALRAIQRQTKTIPIVFVGAEDPLESGIVRNIAHPDGNVTGFTRLFGSLGGKWLELLKGIAPNITRVAYIHRMDISDASYLDSIGDAARSLGVQIVAIPVSDAVSMKAAVKAFAAEPNGGLLPSPLFVAAEMLELNSSAARYRLPAVYGRSLLRANGGLLSYTSDFPEILHGAATYVDRLLRGAKVSDLPVQYPTKFHLVINLKTAKALGLEVPPSILARADEVIE
jgi:putative tryptophan/tyrosine transport system substrate-binding protein